MTPTTRSLDHEWNGAESVAQVVGSVRRRKKRQVAGSDRPSIGSRLASCSACDPRDGKIAVFVDFAKRLEISDGHATLTNEVQRAIGHRIEECAGGIDDLAGFSRHDRRNLFGSRRGGQGGGDIENVRLTLHSGFPREMRVVVDGEGMSSGKAVFHHTPAAPCRAA